MILINFIVLAKSSNVYRTIHRICTRVAVQISKEIFFFLLRGKLVAAFWQREIRRFVQSQSCFEEAYLSVQSESFFCRQMRDAAFFSSRETKAVVLNPFVGRYTLVLQRPEIKISFFHEKNYFCGQISLKTIEREYISSVYMYLILKGLTDVSSLLSWNDITLKNFFLHMYRVRS